MNKFTKLLLLIILEVIFTAIFLGISENSDLAAAIIFPPIFAITLYFLIFTTLEVEHKSKKTHIIFALLLASIALFSSSIGLWVYFKKIHKLNNINKENHFQTTMFDMFMMTFFGSLIGAILALLAIEANIIKHSLIFIIIFMPFLFFKYKNYKPKTIGKDFIPFMFSSISSFIAISLAYYLLKNGLIITSIK